MGRNFRSGLPRRGQFQSVGPNLGYHDASPLPLAAGPSPAARRTSEAVPPLLRRRRRATDSTTPRSSGRYRSTAAAAALCLAAESTREAGGPPSRAGNPFLAVWLPRDSAGGPLAHWPREPISAAARYVTKNHKTRARFSRERFAVYLSRWTSAQLSMRITAPSPPSGVLRRGTRAPPTGAPPGSKLVESRDSSPPTSAAPQC